ncbi:phytoene desaturase [Natronobacillus azotifigens]|uniref:Phytoene desaturase family protein n=1 Tax=Natronobacillus azotifigens TaxID=472978 RepID=A0A9J6RC37_9BACI|nr:phytoene desaturase family protein [Natronobacillus azotifigens]MCZ0702777.1 phytoene desaturase family protein [Natronobacillus azotifigens]
MNIAVVGAGVGGLTTALLLEQAGHEVTIYEKEPRLGGRLTYQTNGEYTVDQGPTIVLLPDLLLEILAEVGISSDAVDLIRCDPLYDIHYSDGTTLRKWQDQRKQTEEIARTFPREVAGYEQYMEEMRKIYHFGTKAFLSRTFSLKREFLSFENVKFVLASQSYKSVTAYLTRFFDDIRMRHAYALQTLYIGGAPHQVPALYGLISYSEHEFGIWYVKGGYYSLVDVLEKACQERGIRLYKGTQVNRILVEQKKVHGISTEQGDFHYDKVIYNGDYPTIESLIPNETVVQKKLKPSSGCVMVYLGVNKRYDQVLTHQFYLSDDFDQYMEKVAQDNRLPVDPSCYVFNPVTIDAEAAPDGKSVLYVLIPVSAGVEYDQAELEQFVEKQITRLEQVSFPDLREVIEWKSIRTPKDALAEGLFGGGSFGAAPTITQSGAFRPQLVHPTIKGLYAVGASVHPGGGIPIVMQGARLLSEAIKKGE